MIDAAGPAFEELLRRTDYDRYFASLFAPKAARPHLATLYAFNYEVAKTAESVSQPIGGQIRLQWWRDRVADIYHRTEADHPLTRALGETIAAHHLPRELFDALVDAHEDDLEEVPFESLQALEAYADATSANVMRLSARILGAKDALDPDAHELGIAYALAGLLRALPYHASRRRFMLPRELAGARDIAIEDVFAGKRDASLTAMIEDLAAIARTHFDACSSNRIPRRFLPALLPATLVPLYLKQVTRKSFNPLHDISDVTIVRRQLAMLAAVIRSRV